MNKNTKYFLYLVFLLFTFKSSIILADDLSDQTIFDVFSGDISEIPQTTVKKSTKLSVNLGWHLPGKKYHAGDGWFALICNRTEATDGCKLYPTKLDIINSKQKICKSAQVDSQLLHWSPLPFNLDKLSKLEEKSPLIIAILKPTSPLLNFKIKAGSVKTYVHEGMKSYQKTDRLGSLEVRFFYQKNKFADLIPRIELKSKQDSIFTFELRINNLSQRLNGFDFPEDDKYLKYILSPQEYLLWAGDLDGDDKPDLVLSHSISGVSIYLSTLANDGELVGLAGSFNSWSTSSAGCK